MLAPTIQLDSKTIQDFCERHHIRKFSIFGSALRRDFAPEGDLDVLVEFEPEHTPGLAFFEMQEELSRLMGRKVDLNTEESLSGYFRERVLQEAKVIYEQE